MFLRVLPFDFFFLVVFSEGVLLGWKFEIMKSGHLRPLE